MYIEWFDVLLTLCLCTTCHKGNQIMPQYSCKKSLQASLSLCLNLSLCANVWSMCKDFDDVGYVAWKMSVKANVRFSLHLLTCSFCRCYLPIL
jgi:hypothetical protein